MRYSSYAYPDFQNLLTDACLCVFVTLLTNKSRYVSVPKNHKLFACQQEEPTITQAKFFVQPVFGWMVVKKLTERRKIHIQITRNEITTGYFTRNRINCNGTTFFFYPGDYIQLPLLTLHSVCLYSLCNYRQPRIFPYARISITAPSTTHNPTDYFTV